MLGDLRARTHQVLSGIAVRDTEIDEIFTDLCSTQVEMRDYGHEEIEDYVASGDPLDKAGAYAIQHPGFKPVENLQGCYANVVGLPLCHLTRTLREVNHFSDVDIPQVCQTNLEFQCSVYAQVLRGEDI